MAKDLSLQPESKYVLLTGAGRPTYYAIDSFEQIGSNMFFYAAGRNVYCCRQEGTWAVVAREACHIITDADYAKHQVDEAKELESFYAELDPKGWEEAQKVAAAGGLEALLNGGQTPHTHGRPHTDDGKPVPGQYL